MVLPRINQEDVRDEAGVLCHFSDQSSPIARSKIIGRSYAISE
jgi:hypothetical protein